jgi:putative glutamine amidotransferase
MRKAPVVLISPHVEKKGDEFGDVSISLSETYQQALISAGAIPIVLPMTTSREVIAECVSRSDGVLLTGGDDVEPKLYTKKLSSQLRKTVGVTHGERDRREMILIEEVFQKRKPLLAICRGQQILNVALGGTLVVDIPMELPGAMNHRRMDRKCEVVHEVTLTSDSLLATITRRRRLGVNSTHHQAVARVAEPLQVTAKSDDGVVEAMELKRDAKKLLPFLLSVQFHPERLAPKHPEHRRIFESFVNACISAHRKKV